MKNFNFKKKTARKQGILCLELNEIEIRKNAIKKCHKKGYRY